MDKISTDTPVVGHDDKLFMAHLRDNSNALAEQLLSGNFDDASVLIHQLLDVRNTHIFKAVGQLTRGLHNAIVNFHVDADLDTSPPDIASSEIRDASDRLQYVIDMTQGAADKTMDKVEAAAPIAMNLRQESATIKDEWQRLKRREMSKEEFKELYQRVEDFLDQMDIGTEQLNQSLQGIILEQGYQDLTGQVLKKVIDLVREVEFELVSLLRIAGHVEAATGIANAADQATRASADKKAEAEGPQIHADKRDDVVSGQDEVDDLLSSLGF